MRYFTTLALGLVGAAVASASDVSDLTEKTFKDFVKSNDLVLAECKSLRILGATPICTDMLIRPSLCSMFPLI